MDADVRKLLEYVDREVFTGPERWCQDVNQTMGGAKCLFYAVHTAAPKVDHLRAMHIRDEAFAAMGFKTLGEVSGWNDEPGRPFADIKRRLATALKEE